VAHALTVGIVAESMVDLHAIRSVVADSGLQVASSIEFSQWNPQQALRTDVAAWIINLDIDTLEALCPEKIGALIDGVVGAMILCDGKSPPTPAEPAYPGWKRRMVEKLRGIAGDITVSTHATRPPACVWVLAGSVGGPESIHRFLEALPPDLDIAFVYANHLQKDFERVLAEATAKNSNYPAYVVQHGDMLAVNKVAVISPEYVTTVMPNGTVQVNRQCWKGAYQPNLDYVISNVAANFGHTGGVIIFSGTCNDGAASCRIMKQNGGKVWVQQFDTCISSAMPEAALATGCAEKMGTPEQLANELVFWSNDRKRQPRAK